MIHITAILAADGGSIGFGAPRHALHAPASAALTFSLRSYCAFSSPSSDFLYRYSRRSREALRIDDILA